MKKLILMLVTLFVLATNAVAQIGSLSADLVFTPITPCRIVDTRGAGGVIPAATSRVFKGWAANYTAQGGKADNCGLPQTTDIAALAVNLLVIVPAAEGWIAAWPVGTTMPLVSNLNYKANDVLANSAILKINQTTADFNVYTVASTHLAVDVTGYYAKPVSLGSLQCSNTINQTSTFPPNAYSGLILGTACAAGYTLLSTRCSYFSGELGVNVAKNELGLCAYNNTTANTKTVFIENTCCRIPGR
jgi:hypothetical protein